MCVCVCACVCVCVCVCVTHLIGSKGSPTNAKVSNSQERCHANGCLQATKQRRVGERKIHCPFHTLRDKVPKVNGYGLKGNVWIKLASSSLREVSGEPILEVLLKELDTFDTTNTEPNTSAQAKKQRLVGGLWNCLQSTLTLNSILPLLFMTPTVYVDLSSADPGAALRNSPSASSSTSLGRTGCLSFSLCQTPCAVAADEGGTVQNIPRSREFGCWLTETLA